MWCFNRMRCFINYLTQCKLISITCSGRRFSFVKYIHKGHKSFKNHAELVISYYIDSFMTNGKLEKLYKRNIS